MKKDIFRLIRNFILISVPLFVLVIYTWACPLNYLSTEYTLWAEEKDYVNCSSQTPDTVIIGDSRAKSSIIPAELHDSIYNIGIGGTTPIEMYYAVSDYIKKHGAPKNAIIIFAPYHLCDIDNWNQTLYYNYLSPGELADVYSRAVPLRDPVIACSGWFTDAVSYRLRLPQKYLAAEYEAGFTGNRSANLSRFSSVRADCGWCEFGTAAGDNGENYETHHETFDSSPLILLYYDRLLDLLDANGVNTIVGQAPINQASSDIMHQAFLDGYRSYLDRQEQKYPDITFVKDIPVYENRYFGDSNHLNKAGASLFTSELKSYLESSNFPW